MFQGGSRPAGGSSGPCACRPLFPTVHAGCLPGRDACGADAGDAAHRLGRRAIVVARTGRSRCRTGPLPLGGQTGGGICGRGFGDALCTWGSGRCRGAHYEGRTDGSAAHAACNGTGARRGRSAGSGGAPRRVRVCGNARGVPTGVHQGGAADGVCAARGRPIRTGKRVLGVGGQWSQPGVDTGSGRRPGGIGACATGAAAAPKGMPKARGLRGHRGHRQRS